jgi:APA family basic amino acid/polyamine antiporter
MPHGASGVVAGAGYVFFSYIGFDSVCTLAEESRNPGRDLPVGILGSLAIVSLLYMVVSLVITGLVPSASLAQEAPLSQVKLRYKSEQHVVLPNFACTQSFSALAILAPKP